MSRFQPGNTASKGYGRRRGSKSKIPQQLHLMISKWAKREFAQVQDDWMHLSRTQRVTLFFKEITGFIIPKQQSNTSSHEFEKLDDQTLQALVNNLKAGVINDDEADKKKMKVV